MGVGRGECGVIGAADDAVTIEILVESGFDRLQRGIGGSNNPNRAGRIVAIAIGRPHRELTGCCVLPGYVVTAADLFGPDWRPRPICASDDDGATIFQLRSGPPANRIEEVVGAD